VPLSEQASRDHFRLAVFDSLASTNDEAIARARQGDPGRLWIVARRQTAGRGRNGRHWASPEGNLYASLLLIDPGPVGLSPQLGFVAGAALASSLNRLSRADPPIRLKWPNDAVHRGAKLAGLLVEGTGLEDGRLACVIGIGVNCSSHPVLPGLAATNLAAIAGRKFEPSDVLTALSDEIAQFLPLWQSGGNFAAIRERWLTLAAGLGTTITARTAKGVLQGVFRTIDESGRLLLETVNGPVKIEAGDVFLSAEDAVGRRGLG
jgi:BirA family biotin operon repressor/biotin-[acetyl-CoA-carboxylase] ligase